MDRIQSCNFNFTINRQDVNEFGKLARIDSIINEPPTVGLDFSYYVTDGFNERLLGFNVTGVVDGQAPGGASIDTNTAVNAQCISGLLSDLQGNNYYILTVDEGEDVVGGTRFSRYIKYCSNRKRIRNGLFFRSFCWWFTYS